MYLHFKDVLPLGPPPKGENNDLPSSGRDNGRGCS